MGNVRGSDGNEVLEKLIGRIGFSSKERHRGEHGPFQINTYFSFLSEGGHIYLKGELYVLSISMGMSST